jgi:transposase
MASLVRKKIRGHFYWYAVESQRVNGKPRIVWQKYLGKAEDIVRRMTEGEPETETVVYEFGTVAAVLAIAQRLDLEAILSRFFPKRQQGLPVGRYLLLAAINRVVAATSKAKLGAWYEETVLFRLWGTSAEEFSSQRFWEALDRVTEDGIRAAEQAVATAAVQQFGVAVDGLIYDGTNFFSYIDTTNPAAIPQRGHNKQKRNDLRQINLALMVTRDGHVPLLHEVYPGNVPDSPEFAAILPRLVERSCSLGDGEQELTMVYDKGNFSAQNLAAIDKTPLHFVSSLLPAHHPDLTGVPLSQFVPLDKDRWPGLLGYRTTKRIGEQTRATLVTFNPNLREGQLQGLHAQQAKIEAALSQLQAQLAVRAAAAAPRGRRPTPETVRRSVKRLLRGRQVGSFLTWRVEQNGDKVELTYAWDEDAFRAWDERNLGKTILFSDHLDWTDAALVAAYRGQANIEDAFKQWKDPHFVSWWPLFHWTDSKIRVHAFYCTLALLLASLLYREMRKAGAEGDFNHLMAALAGIRGVLDLPKEGAGRRQGLRIRLSRRSPEQQKLYDLLELQRFQPTSLKA